MADGCGVIAENHEVIHFQKIAAGNADYGPYLGFAVGGAKRCWSQFGNEFSPVGPKCKRIIMFEDTAKVNCDGDSSSIAPGSELKLYIELHLAWRVGLPGLSKVRRRERADIRHVIAVVEYVEGIQRKRQPFTFLLVLIPAELEFMA